MSVKNGKASSGPKLRSINETALLQDMQQGRSMFHMKRFGVRLPYAFF